MAETFLDGVNDLIVVQHDVRQQVQAVDVEDIDSSPRVIGDAQVMAWNKTSILVSS
jgi:hypothetical protein